MILFPAKSLGIDRGLGGPYSLKYPCLLSKASLVLFCLETPMLTEGEV